MKFEATIGNLIIKPLSKEDTTTKSGIVLTATAEQSRSIKGEVIAVGACKVVGGVIMDMQAKVGDTVLFDTYKASDLDFEGEKYHRIEEDKIFGILR